MRLPALLAAVLLALAGGGPVLAQPQPAAVAPLLAPGRIDPLRLLPPPPAEASAEQKAELAELHRIQDARTPARFAQAKWDSDHEDASAFAAVLGPKFDLAALPATGRLLATVTREQSGAKKLAKADFHRPRPWVVDPTLVGCDHSDDKPNSSYPSGHTTLAFALGVVLADLAPERSQEILARARDYAESRLVCGVHFRSDIIAGEAFGTVIGAELLDAPGLRPEIEAARAELRRAGLTAQ